ncbi:hypothetical protein AB0B30_39485 [Streptomyces narbonensis]|uniref:helix-turn-helix transcriptional regulator n=1 Tax=Streptomyces narbonensis TaxID=67333 RepID=UPI0033C739A5
MIPADADELVTTQDIAQRYKAHEKTVRNWMMVPGFPEGWPQGPGRTLVRKAAEVDRWLKENRPVEWAKGQDSGNPFGLPAGKPTDLVTLSDICAWEGKALGRTEPVPEATLRSYISRKVLAAPDRTPGDGKRPEVFERKWFRLTAYNFVNRPRTRMRRQTKAEEAPASEQAPAAGGVLPSPSPTARAEYLAPQGIATTYAVSGPTAKAWTRVDGFPEAGDNGYSAAEVDEWVRNNRRRSWAAARRRAEQAGRTRPTDSSVDAGGNQVKPAPATGSATGTQGGHDALTAATIGARYGVSEQTGRQWTTVREKREGRKILRRAFPAPLDSRSAEAEYAPGDVDAWVRENHPHVWAVYTGTGPALVNPLPEGDPLDLLDIYDFAEILGMATRGEPLARETITAYHARGQVPYVDRTSGDGKKPEVFSDHWYRRTVYEFVLSRRGSGNFEARS